MFISQLTHPNILILVQSVNSKTSILFSIVHCLHCRSSCLTSEINSSEHGRLILTIDSKVGLFVCQSSVATLEPFLSKEVSRCREISDVLLAGDHLGVP